jgi:hypothetical protein
MTDQPLTDQPWLQDDPPAGQSAAMRQRLAPMLGRTLHQYADLGRTKADLETRLKSVTGQMRVIEERTLPDLMDQMGVAEMRADSGVKIKLQQVITASLTNAEDRKRAVAWLRAMGSESLVKREITAHFGKGMDGQADAAFKLLTATFAKDAAISDEETVNTASFKAFVRELLDKKGTLPPEGVGVYVVRKAVLSA